MELIYYLPHHFYGPKGVGTNRYPLQASFSQMFNPSISLVDRSRAIGCPPMGIRIMDEFPSWSSADSFENLCQRRYDELLVRSLESNKRLVIFYSGGIDSTLIAALAISHQNWHQHKERVYLAFSEDSIKENPRFWMDSLRREFGGRLLNSTAYHDIITNEGNFCITGEFADNIFGSLTLKSYMDNSGDTNAIHKAFRTTGMEWMLGKILQPKHRTECAQMLEALLATGPRTLESNHDCFWWLNFVLKWQAVKYRLASHAPGADMVAVMCRRVIHFFETKEFQNWAVMTDEKKVENDWFSYKLPAKKMIFSVNKDQDYLTYKTKYPSIPGLTRYANTWPYIYLDENGNYHAKQDLIS